MPHRERDNLKDETENQVCKECEINTICKPDVKGWITMEYAEKAACYEK